MPRGLIGTYILVHAGEKWQVAHLVARAEEIPIYSLLESVFENVVVAQAYLRALEDRPLA
jgi:D-mannonate dehydratase